MRAGNFTTKKVTYSAYHLHSTSIENVSVLMQAIHNYASEKRFLLKNFNLKVTIQPFPNNHNRETKANTIAVRLVKVHHSFSPRFKLPLKHTFDQGISLEDTERITNIQDLITFCYQLIRVEFYITLYFRHTNITNHYTALHTLTNSS